jgi:agarase
VTKDNPWTSWAKILCLFLMVLITACGGGGGSSGSDGGTVTADTTPDSFSFSAQSDVELSTAVTSDSITVSGIDAATSISISGADGKYAIDGGSFTSSAGTVTNGQSVVVRVTSAGDYSTPVETTLTIGGFYRGGDSGSSCNFCHRVH